MISRKHMKRKKSAAEAREIQAEQRVVGKMLVTLFQLEGFLNDAVDRIEEVERFWCQNN